MVLVSIDTLRSDHLPFYGYSRLETPAFSELAATGIVFEKAYSPCPLTLPAHASVFSGLLPPAHGVRDNAGFTVAAESDPWLPEAFRRAGYRTGAAVSAFVLRPATGLAQGFDFYDAAPRPAPGQSLAAGERPGQDTIAAALAWLAGLPAGKPFFLFVHLYEPHSPYSPPAPFATRYGLAYDGEIAAADAAVGQLFAGLRKLGVYDRSVIVLLSDHGESLGEHGEAEHGVFVYREVLQVPLVVRLPGGASAGRRAESVSLVDVAPTVAELAGLAAWEGGDGRSLTTADESRPARRIYAESFYGRIHLGWSELVSLLDGRHHYIEAPEPELYDLEADRGETVNVAASERRTAARFAEELRATERRFAPPGATDAETRRQLSALGYFGSGGPLPAGQAIDPKSQRVALAALAAARKASARHDHPQAEQVYARLVAANPGMVDAWFGLADARAALARTDGARDALDGAIRASRGAASVRLAAADALIRLGRLAEAEERGLLAAAEDPAAVNSLRARIAELRGDAAGAAAIMARAVAVGEANEELRRNFAQQLLDRGRAGEAAAVLAPLAAAGEPSTLTLLAAAWTRSGRTAAAAGLLDRVLAIDPNFARAHEGRGALALASGAPAEARDHFRRCLELDPGLASGWTGLGVALYQIGLPAEGIAAWRRAVAVDPGEYRAWFNLGLVAAEAGDRREARRALMAYVAIAPATDREDVARARSMLRALRGARG